jgi:hypothetical protein
LCCWIGPLNYHRNTVTAEQPQPVLTFLIVEEQLMGQRAVRVEHTMPAFGPFALQPLDKPCQVHIQSIRSEISRNRPAPCRNHLNKSSGEISRA